MNEKLLEMLNHYDGELVSFVDTLKEQAPLLMDEIVTMGRVNTIHSVITLVLLFIALFSCIKIIKNYNKFSKIAKDEAPILVFLSIMGIIFCVTSSIGIWCNLDLSPFIAERVYLLNYVTGLIK